MLTVSDAFLTAWRNRSCKFAVRKVSYKRRYWNGSAFVYEAEWRELAMRDFLDIGTKNEALDTVQANIFKTSNITLRLRNLDFRWSPYNTAGLFGADDVAENGYQAYRTMFKVEAGYTLADGSDELPIQFTGYLVDFNMPPFGGVFEADIAGRALDLEEADAQEISDPVSDGEVSPSVGDGVITDFRTTAVGVAFIDSVYVGETLKVEGSDYTISDVNDVDQGALIKFKVPPQLADGDITWNGSTWKQNKKVEELAELLCDYAGIESADRTIEPVLFPSGAPGFKQISDQAGWENGSLLQNISAEAVVDSITRKWMLVDDFSNNNYTSPRAWTFSGSGTPSAASGYLSVAMSPSQQYIMHTPLVAAAGTWRFRAKYTPSSTPGGQFNIFFQKLGTNYLSDGYAIQYNGPYDGVNPVVTLRRMLYTGGSYTYYSLGTIFQSAVPSGWHEWVITKSDTGEIKVYYDNTLMLTVTDTSFGSASYFAITGATAGDDYSTGEIDDIYYAPLVLDGTAAFDGEPAAVYESEEFDLLEAPTAWGRLEVSEILNSGSIVYSTAVRDPSGTWDDWTEISGTGQILSDLKQMLKIRVAITPAAGSMTPPSCRSVKANFTSSTIFVSLAVFTGMNCWQALESLADKCNYEIGVDASARFFFRSKNTSTTPVLELDQRDVVRVSSFKPGWKEVRNVSQVYYAPYRKKYDSSSLPETAPTSENIFGERLLNKTMTGFLLANDADIATGMAQIGHDDRYRPRRRLRVDFRLIPFLELSDPIQLALYINPIDEDTVFGDPLQVRPMFGANYAVPLRPTLFKVLGANQQYQAGITSAQLEEILV